jgi:nicotinamidase-related amidase
MSSLNLDPRTSALVLVDLQRGTRSLPLGPYTGGEVVDHAAQLATAFRGAGAPVILVHVGLSADGRDRLQTEVDRPLSFGELPPDFFELVPEIRGEHEILVMKKQWSAFYGTDLDLQLRRRGVQTVVLGGIATNFGVESTARAAQEHAYNVVLVEDAMSGLSAEDHQFALTKIFPLLGRVTSTDVAVAAISR